MRFNEHLLHRVPASPTINQREELPLPSADAHDATHWATHPGSPDEGLIEDGSFNLAGIR